MTPDFKRLAVEVTARHGIRVDPDDPVMVIVTLNCLMLESAAGEVEERMRRVLGDFERAVERVQVRAGEAIADEVRRCAAERREYLNPVHDAGRARAVGHLHPPDPRHRWPVSHVLYGLGMFFAGVGVGLLSR